MIAKSWKEKMKGFLHYPTSISLLVFVALLCGSSYAVKAKSTRTFSVAINPDCETLLTNSTEDCSKDTSKSLVHIRSDGAEDSLHFVWSFLGAPTLLLARTPLHSNLSLDWNLIMQGVSGESAIKFEPRPVYTFGWGLVEVWFYHDENDTARLDKADISNIQGYDTKYFLWNYLTNSSTYNSSMINLSFEARAYDHEEGEGSGVKPIGPNGFFRITIRMKNTEDYSTVLPYMMYNENNTQVDIAFNDVQLNTTEDEYPKHPRVALKYVLVQDNGNRNASAGKMQLEVSKTLDDEHSPGVFQVYKVKTPTKGIDHSYLEWRPICYTAEVRDVIDSVDVVAYPLQTASSVVGNDNIQGTLLWSYFGPEIDSLSLEALNISFGTQGDGFYNKTKHISWTYTTGFGNAPPDRVSMLVMLVVSIGLGIPALIIVFSVIYMACKVRRPRDELLLGQ